MSHELLEVIEKFYHDKYRSRIECLNDRVTTVERINGEQKSTIASLSAAVIKADAAGLVAHNGRTAEQWEQVALNWQGRADDAIRRVRTAEAKAHIEREARQALEHKLASIPQTHAELLTANEHLRRIQGSKDKEVASIRNELEMLREAHNRLQAAYSEVCPTGVYRDGATANKYQLRNGVVLLGEEITENNREAR